MAKNSSTRTGTSKVRFIMLEADIAEGDLSQITQAIQNALKPAHAVPRLTARLQTSTPTEQSDTEEVAEEADFEEQMAVPPPPARAARGSSKRTYRTPDVIDVELDSPTSFVDFANSKNPGSTFDKYLIVAAWFKLHRKVDAVTADHVYTCFRKIGWSVAINNFSKPLQNLKKSKLMGGDASGFTINHLGLDRVDKLGSTAK